MKKILIIEDTQANIDAAKSFFTTITGYEFIYCTNRKDAEKHLEEAYAVITDRSLPFFNEIEPEEFVFRANGWIIALNSKNMGKPTVIISAHGDALFVGGINNSHQLFKEAADKAKDLVGTEIKYTDFVQIRDYQQAGVIKTPQLGYIEKNIVDAWEIAWEKLIQQF